MLTLSSLGTTLTDALDDLIGAERMDPQLAMKVLMQFDRVITEALNEKVKARLTFKVNILLFWILHDPRILHLSQRSKQMSSHVRTSCTRNTEPIHLIHTLSVFVCLEHALHCYHETRWLTVAGILLANNTQGSLDTYRFCDEVWTFLIKNVTFKMDGGQSVVTADKVKIVSCSAKRSDEK